MSLFDSSLEAVLHDLDERGLLRRETDVPADVLVLCSNDYLGYASEPVSSLGVDDSPSGAGASRLISGDQPAHRGAERAIANWLGCEDALLFSSGYAANVGALSALTQAGDVILSDELNHASLIDGCRLSRAQVRITSHLDVDALRRGLVAARSAKRRWIVTESYFSMDGDSPDLAALRALADEHAAFLVVDEAHALGVFGEEGAGRCREAGILPDVLIGTLGKALGLSGAFIAGSASLRRLLWNRARSFVFSTAVPPWLAVAAAARVRRVRDDRRARNRLEAITSRVREALASMGAPVGASSGPIVPLVIGDARRVMTMRDELLRRGVFVQAIRPPTVPEATSRLRLTLHAKLSDAELERALGALAGCLSDASVQGTPPRPSRTS